MTQSSVPQSPRLTIMISCYRKNRWFAETLETFMQSGYHFRNTEFLICDDGSPADGDGDVAEAYAAKYPGLFRVLHNGVNKGAAYSHHRLIQEARGQYVMPFDCDDIFVPFDIDFSLDFLDKHPEYAATCGKKMLFSAEKGYLGISHGGDYSTFAMLLDPRVTHNGMIYRKADVRPEWAYRLPSGKQCKAAFDISLWLGLGLQKELYYVNEIRAFFRIHSHQITATSHAAYAEDYEMLRDELLSLYPELVQKANSHQQFTIHSNERFPMAIVLGVLFWRAETAAQKLFYLNLAEQLMPNDYAIPEYRIKVLRSLGRNSEALGEAFRIYAMHPGCLYIESLTLGIASECLEAMQLDSSRMRQEHARKTAEFFTIKPEQQKLLDTVSKRARELDL